MHTSLQTERLMNHAMSTWADTVYRIALAHTRSPQDAEDVVQDVFLSLLRCQTRFANDEHLKAWLVRTTINRCRALHRLAWTKRVVADEASLEAAVSPEEAELFEHPVWQALGALPEAMRVATTLHYIEGYTTEEIADMMHKRPATIRSYLHRARKKLKAELEKEVSHEGVHARIPQPRTQRPSFPISTRTP